LGIFCFLNGAAKFSMWTELFTVGQISASNLSEKGSAISAANHMNLDLGMGEFGLASTDEPIA
jgi:hypothetical protein